MSAIAKGKYDALDAAIVARIKALPGLTFKGVLCGVKDAVAPIAPFHVKQSSVTRTRLWKLRKQGAVEFRRGALGGWYLTPRAP